MGRLNSTQNYNHVIMQTSGESLNAIRLMQYSANSTRSILAMSSAPVLIEWIDDPSSHDPTIMGTAAAQILVIHAVATHFTHLLNQVEAAPDLIKSLVRAEMDFMTMATEIERYSPLCQNALYGLVSDRLAGTNPKLDRLFEITTDPATMADEWAELFVDLLDAADERLTGASPE